MSKDEQGTFRREHADIRTGHQSNVMPPYTAGIDSNLCIIVRDGIGIMVENLDSPDSVTVLYEADDFRVDQDFRPVKLGVDHVCCAETERID